MSQTRFIHLFRKALDIHANEVELVRLLGFHHFFQGAGLALFTIIGSTVFLDEFPIYDLPVVYVIASAAMLILGRIYAFLEHRIPVTRLFPMVIISTVVLALIGWANLAFFHVAWTGIALMVIYRLLYLLGSLEFWGLSAIVFDVRQSKRLFGLISAGDVPAKLIGYLAISVLAPYLDLQDFLLVGAICFAISLWFMQRVLSRSHVGHSHGGSHEHHDSHSHGHEHSKNIFQRVFGSRFVLALASLSFIAILVLTLIDYSFLSGVKKRSYSAQELAVFLGLFFAVGKGITIVLKLFLSGRLISRLGVKRSLLILPVSLVILGLALVVERLGGFSDNAIFILFGGMVMISEIFQYALNSPVFLALFQPLDEHSRLAGHTVVKGVTDALSLGLAGGFLLLVTGHKGSATDFLELIAVALIVLSLGWIGIVFWVNRNYFEILKSAVSHRFLEGAQMHIVDQESLNLLREKLDSDLPEEVIYAAELLRNSSSVDFSEVIAKLLAHPSPEVRRSALDLLDGAASGKIRKQLLEIVESSQDQSLRAHALQTFCRISGHDTDEVYPYLESEDVVLKRAAIIGLMQTGAIEAIILAGQALLTMVDSDHPEDRLLAAGIVGDLRIRKFYKPLERFLDDPDPRVVHQAIEAAGKIGAPRLLGKLEELLFSAEYRLPALQALPAFGKEGIRMIQNLLRNRKDLNLRQRRELIRAAGLTNDAAAGKFLEAQLTQGPAVLRREALHSLPGVSKQLHDSSLGAKLLGQELDFGYWLKEALQVCSAAPELELLQKALKSEADSLRERLFILLSFLYERAAIERARKGLDTREREKVANALEILDNLIPNKISDRLLPLLDPEAPPLPQNLAPESLLQRILSEGLDSFFVWTLATAIYTSRQSKNGLPDQLRNSFLQHESLLIRQLASGELPDLKSSHDMDASKAPQLLEIEKVIILKSSPLFSETPEEILVEVAQILQTRVFREGQTIVQKGDLGDCMYIIFSGKVRIHDGDHTLGELGRRDFFGELSLLDPAPRSASVTAQSDCLLLQLDQKPFYDLMEERMEVGHGILKVLCQRIRNDNSQILELKSKLSE